MSIPPTSQQNSFLGLFSHIRFIRRTHVWVSFHTYTSSTGIFFMCFFTQRFHLHVSFRQGFHLPVSFHTYTSSTYFFSMSFLTQRFHSHVSLDIFCLRKFPRNKSALGSKRAQKFFKIDLEKFLRRRSVFLFQSIKVYFLGIHPNPQS